MITQSFSPPVVSIVLGSFNRNGFLQKTIESIRNSKISFKIETIVVDGGSTDGSLEWLVHQKDVLTIVQHNRGEWLGKKIEKRSWGYFMNLAFKSAQGKYVLMISDDCYLHDDAIREGVEAFESLLLQGRKIGAMPFFWRNWPNMKNYFVGKTLGDHFFVNHGLYLRKALEEVRFIDEETYQFYCGDGDLCLKMIDQGYEVIPSTKSLVEHSDDIKQLSASSYETAASDQKRYREKWAGKFDVKPLEDWIYQTPSDISQRDQMIQKHWGKLYSDLAFKIRVRGWINKLMGKRS